MVYIHIHPSTKSKWKSQNAQARMQNRTMDFDLSSHSATFAKLMPYAGLLDIIIIITINEQLNRNDVTQLLLLWIMHGIYI